MTITIIIPTYNEKENLPILVKSIFDVFQENFLQGDVIIVDDNSLTVQEESLMSFLQRIIR
ncbi:MAG: glycosyltransferase [Euryarchaeota archaeon]|nr:glycosyltransferase [Euryarchaeota archaeon]